VKPEGEKGKAAVGRILQDPCTSGGRAAVVACVCKKVKVADTRLPSVGFRSRSRFSAVSLQVT